MGATLAMTENMDWIAFYPTLGGHSVRNDGEMSNGPKVLAECRVDAIFEFSANPYWLITIHYFSGDSDRIFWFICDKICRYVLCKIAVLHYLNFWW